MIRYMGTKRHIARFVRQGIESVSVEGPVLDLFAGMGSVATEFADTRPMMLNDASEFVTCMLRASFTSSYPYSTPDREAVDETALRLSEIFRPQLEAEQEALSRGSAALESYISRARHVGNSSVRRKEAALASKSTGIGHYRLCALYFAAGYLSLRQAIQVDALRHVIDQSQTSRSRDPLLSRWLTCVSRALNAPGHSAQFLKPHSQAGFERVLRAWRRDLIQDFYDFDQSADMPGTATWRASNSVTSMDALALMRSGAASDSSVIYADPPYTRDQYGRFYHLYETLFRYDFPDSNGAGRVRSDTFSSSFSRKSLVERSMRTLLQQAAWAQTPLILSYPSNGLLVQAGSSLPSIASDYFRNVESWSLDSDHSTLGASSGARRKATQEQLIICSN